LYIMARQAVSMFKSLYQRSHHKHIGLHTPKLFEIFKCKSESEKNERTWDMFLNSQHFRGKRVCWSSEMQTRMSDKWVNYSYQFAQIKQQVGYYIVEAFLVHERVINMHRLIKFTTAWIWGRPSPSPL
jgi:hypothetical protein